MLQGKPSRNGSEACYRYRVYHTRLSHQPFPIFPPIYFSIGSTAAEMTSADTLAAVSVTTPEPELSLTLIHTGSCENSETALD